MENKGLRQILPRRSAGWRNKKGDPWTEHDSPIPWLEVKKYIYIYGISHLHNRCNAWRDDHLHEGTILFDGVCNQAREKHQVWPQGSIEPFCWGLRYTCPSTTYGAPRLSEGGRCICCPTNLAEHIQQAAANITHNLLHVFSMLPNRTPSWITGQGLHLGYPTNQVMSSMSYDPPFPSIWSIINHRLFRGYIYTPKWSFRVVYAIISRWVSKPNYASCNYLSHILNILLIYWTQKEYK